MKPHYTHRYIKLRCVRSRFYGGDPTYEGKIIGRIRPGVWGTLGTTRGHTTMESARNAILKLADRRGIKVVDDPRELRRIQFQDRYGDE